MNKTILITGSNRGIGKAVALALATDGYDIAVHCRSRRDEAEAVATQIREIGRQARVLQFDVSDRAACRDVLTADVEAHGAYYGVVLNAGLTRDAAFPAFSDDDWDSVLRTNLDGFYNVLHPVIMPMIRRRQDGVGHHGQSRASELQRVQSGHYRRGKGVGGGIGKAQNHGELRCPWLD